jgi:hypothetical protein
MGCHTPASCAVAMPRIMSTRDDGTRMARDDGGVVASMYVNPLL